MRDINRLYKFYDELREIHMTYYQLEVIGNVYDNPELIEK